MYTFEFEKTFNMNQQLSIENQFISTQADHCFLANWIWKGTCPRNHGYSDEAYFKSYWNLTKQLIDETQIIVFKLIGSEKGHVLEIVVSRMRRISSHIATWQNNILMKHRQWIAMSSLIYESTTAYWESVHIYISRSVKWRDGVGN